MERPAKHIIQSKCWEFDIRIYPVPVYGNGERVSICIEKKGVPSVGKTVYNQFSRKDKNKGNIPNMELYQDIDNYYWHYYQQIVKRLNKAA